jgi:hypothetical protein
MLAGELYIADDLQLAADSLRAVRARKLHGRPRRRQASGPEATTQEAEYVADDLTRGVGIIRHVEGMVAVRLAVRFARLIHRRGRALGRPSAGAAFGGSPSLPWCHAGWCHWSSPSKVNSQFETFMVMLTA